MQPPCFARTYDEKTNELGGLVLEDVHDAIGAGFETLGTNISERIEGVESWLEHLSAQLESDLVNTLQR